VLKGAVEGAADPGGALNPDVGDLEAAPEGALADDVDGQYWMGGGGGGGDGKVSGDGGGGGGGGGGGPGAPGGVWLPLGDGLDSAGAGARNCLRSRLFPACVEERMLK